MMSFCDRARERCARRALLVGDRDVEREQPGGRGVDGHRGVHLAERDAVEQRAHVAEMGDRHADLADLAARQHVVGVVAGLGRQIEGDREAGLPLGEVLAVERVRFARGRMARIGAEDPGLVALGSARLGSSTRLRSAFGSQCEHVGRAAIFAVQAAMHQRKKIADRQAAFRTADVNRCCQLQHGLEGRLAAQCGCRASWHADTSGPHGGQSLPAQAAESIAAEGSLRDRRDPAARPRAGEDVRLGDPQGAPRPARDSSMQLEVVPTWPIGEDEVLVLVMAAGVNYNGVWAGLGQPISPLDVHKNPYPHRRLRRVRHRLGGRRQGEALEGRRRGHRPLQSGRRRRRGLQRRRSAAVALAAHLGLRDAGRLVRAVLPRAVAPADGQAEAPHLGRGGLLHAHARHRLSHAVRPSRRTRSSPATTCWSGARPAGSACSACSSSRPRAPTRSASSPTRASATTCCDLGAKGVDQPQGLQVLGPDAEGEHARIQRLGQGGAQVRQGDLGHHRQARRRHRVRASGRGDLPGLVPGGEARRHGGVLRRHHRLQPHLRRALCVDAPEAHPGLALRASQAGDAPPTSSCSTAASIPA